MGTIRGRVEKKLERRIGEGGRGERGNIQPNT
jgi:hypothetical protein